MNFAQRIVLAVGAIAIALMALFPAWNSVYDYPGNPRYVNRAARRIERFAGYHPIWQANTPTDQTYLASLFSIPADSSSSLGYFSIQLSTTRLCIQIGATIILTPVLIAFFSSAAGAGTHNGRE